METFEEWKSGFEGLCFEESAKRFRDKILESPDLDDKSRKYFFDAFNYVLSIQQSGKILDTNLMKIHMTDIKGHKGMTLQDFTRCLMLLSLCGFQFDNVSPDKSN